VIDRPYIRHSPCWDQEIYLCGQLLGGTRGSYALTCSDEHGLPNGAVRLVAHDGSVLTEGVCNHGYAIGAWFDWREGRLQRAVALGSGEMFGLSIFWGYDGNYYHRVERFPGKYLR
jgi:hypothetical protein